MHVAFLYIIFRIVQHCNMSINYEAFPCGCKERLHFSILSAAPCPAVRGEIWSKITSTYGGIMPRCCITKYLVEELKKQGSKSKLTHYYDEEVQGFMLEHRGYERGTWYFKYVGSGGSFQFYRIGSMMALPLMEARANAYMLHNMVADGVDIKKDVHKTQEALLFESFAHTQYIPHARLKKRSWELDQRILRLHILPRFGRCQMDKVRRTDILAWQTEMREKGLAPGTCNRAFVVLKTVFNCAIRWSVLAADKNPCRCVTLFEDKRLRERYLSPEEARRLLMALDALPHRQGAQAIRLLLFTGARKQEILAARWEHVDFERRLLTVPLSKSGKTRHIPLSDDAVDVLKNLQRTESPWLFPQKNGKGPIQSVAYLWGQLRGTLGLDDVRLHDLRHSFASFLVNAGCSLYEVQRCLGHYDPKVTMRYAHLASHALVKAANMVGKSVWA